MAFPATDAALEGFKITRARPSAALVWAGVQLVLAFANRLAVIAIGGKQLAALPTNDPMTMLAHPEQLSAYTGLIFGIAAVSVAMGVIGNGFLYAAAARSVMQPERRGPGWLACGMDELRQMAVLALYLVVLFAAYIGGAFVASAALGLILAPLFGNVGIGITVILSMVLDLAFVIWVGVRLSLAPSATFAQRRLVFFDTWKLTRGRFWPLLGAYLVSWLLAILVFVLVMAIGSVIWVMMAGTTEATAAQTTDFASLVRPANLVLLLFSAVAYGLMSLLVLTPPPYIYRQFVAAAEAAAKAF